MTDNRSSLLDDLDSDKSSEFASDVESLQSAVETAKDQDRSTIAKWLILAFISILIALIIYVLIGPFLHECWDDIQSASEFALQITSSVLLPVVTLVLGYYFGTNRD